MECLSPAENSVSVSQGTLTRQSNNSRFQMKPHVTEKEKESKCFDLWVLYGQFKAVFLQYIVIRHEIDIHSRKKIAQNGPICLGRGSFYFYVDFVFDNNHLHSNDVISLAKSATLIIHIFITSEFILNFTQQVLRLHTCIHTYIFRSLLWASRVSRHTNDMWYKETVWMWMTMYICIYI